MGAPAEPLRVLVAGGGVAGLEALLALRALAGERVSLTLVDPREDFTYRPMTVAEPFAAGHASRYPFADLETQTGARHVRDALREVDAERHLVRTADGAELTYDVLLLTLGADARPAFERALTFDDRRPEAVGGLLRDVEQGDARRVAVVVPPGPHWTLPAYELALLLAHQAHGMGIDDLEVVVVVPEHAPLAVFGPVVSAQVREELAAAGVRLEAGAFADLRPGHATTVVLHPGHRTLDVDRVIALPRLEPRHVPGVPTAGDGFLSVDGFGRVRGVRDVYAAGDGTDFPVKQGGLATQQADAAAQHIAARAGADVTPVPFRPVLRGRLLTGRGDRWLRHDHDRTPMGAAAGHALWWPPGKIAGRYLSPYLAAHDPAAAAALEPPSVGEDVEVLVGTPDAPAP